MKKMKNLLVCASLLITGVLSAQQTETRKLSSFSKVDIGGPFDVYLEKGNEESVKIDVEGVTTDKVITEVKGNTLNVGIERGEYKRLKGKIYITYKDIDAIDKSGSGNLTCKSDLSASHFLFAFSGSGNAISKKIKAQHVNITKSGSGNIKVDAVDTDDADIAVSGSGDLEIHDGFTKTQSVHLDGSGNVRAYGLKSNKCSAVLSGSGNINVNVSETLEGSIAGSGNISYDGNATVKSTVAGSGRLSKR